MCFIGNTEIIIYTTLVYFSMCTIKRPCRSTDEHNLCDIKIPAIKYILFHFIPCWM